MVKNRIDKNYVNLLAKFISFKSVSTDSQFKSQIKDTVKWLGDLFLENNFAVKILTGKNSNPIVVAKYDNNSKETVLIYGHYDVQPAEFSHDWKTDPFILHKTDSKFYGRGVVDNKGQILIHMVTIFDLIKSGNLGFNIKFIIEGNEETANPDMESILKENSELLMSDFILVSDGEILGDIPLIEASLRGGMNIKIKIRTNKNDLHSGTFGGAVLNAANVLIDLLAKMTNVKNEIFIDEFNGWKNKISKNDTNATKILSTTRVRLLESLDNKTLTLSEDENFFLKTGLLPTIQITGIKVGYTNEGFSNIIPCEAEANLNIRIINPQSSDEIDQIITKWVKENINKNVDFTVDVFGKHNPVKLNIDSKIHNKASICLEKAFGKKPMVKFVGGALPFVTLVKEIFGKDALLIPLGNDDCNMHGPNENYSIKTIEKGLQFSREFFTRK